MSKQIFLVCCSFNNGRTLLRQPKMTAMCHRTRPLTWHPAAPASRDNPFESAI
jgi:hypothetical protein